jgi:hypothetical protein
MGPYPESGAMPGAAGADLGSLRRASSGAASARSQASGDAHAASPWRRRVSNSAFHGNSPTSSSVRCARARPWPQGL